MPRTRKVPTRMCVACRRMRPKREMVRVVRTPTGEVKVDPTGKLAGRGAYVCPEPDCVEMGARQGRLQHALEAPIPDEVAVALATIAAAQLEGEKVEGQRSKEAARVIRPLTLGP